MNNLPRIGVLSDTHANRISELPPDLVGALMDMDMIIHLGDYHSKELVDEFKKMGNFRGVTGNHDFGNIHLALPKKDIVEINGKRIGLIHGHGCILPFGFERGLKAKFRDKNLDVILYGHTHVPATKVVEGVLFFNPGSVAGRFPAHQRTYGMLTIGDSVNTNIITMVGAYNQRVPKSIHALARRVGYDWGILIRKI